MKDKIAMITGLNGFLATNLAGALIEKGVKVAGIPRETLANPMLLDDFVSGLSPNYIFHFAAYGNHYDQDDDDEIVSTNILKTYFLFTATKYIDYECFINVSSSSVYGAKSTPMKEDMLLESDTMYGVTKIASESIARAFAKKYNKPIINIRPFSVYGPGEAGHRFIPTLITAIKKEEMEFTLDPNASHDWIYVEDFINGIFAVIANAKDFIGKSVNIGTGKQHTNKEVAETLVSIANAKSPMRLKETTLLRSYDTTNWIADTSLLRHVGFRPKFTLKEGLSNTYEYYNNLKPRNDLDRAMEQSLRMVNAL